MSFWQLDRRGREGQFLVHRVKPNGFSGTEIFFLVWDSFDSEKGVRLQPVMNGCEQKALFGMVAWIRVEAEGQDISKRVWSWCRRAVERRNVQWGSNPAPVTREECIGSHISEPSSRWMFPPGQAA